MTKNFSNPVEVAPGVFRIVVPLWGPELADVNVWAIRCPDGIRLIDAGLNSERAASALVEQLALVGGSVDDVREVFITHLHRDHFGLGERLAAARARVLVLGDPATGRAFDRRDGDWAEGRDWLGRHGFVVEDLPGPREMEASGFHEPDAVMGDGAELAWGDYRFRVVATPGHSPGHACLYEARAGLLASGDHVLARISSHIGTFSDAGPDVLGEFLSSLEKVGRLSVRQVLPGHGPAFDDLKGRVDRLLQHHHQRCDEALAALAGGPATAVEVAASIRWQNGRGGWSALSRVSQLLALSETVAHLRHLAARGEVAAEPEAGDLIRYRRL